MVGWRTRRSIDLFPLREMFKLCLCNILSCKILCKNKNYCLSAMECWLQAAYFPFLHHFRNILYPFSVFRQISGTINLNNLIDWIKLYFLCNASRNNRKGKLFSKILEELYLFALIKFKTEIWRNIIQVMI